MFEQQRDDAFGIADFRRLATDVVDALASYVAASEAGDGPAIGYRPMAEIYERLDLRRWLESGGMDATAFAEFLAAYLESSTRLHHPGYLAHQVGAPTAQAALADLIHGVINNPMAIFEMGPTTSAVEHAVLNWFLEKIGWAPEPIPGTNAGTTGAAPTHGSGVLTHGGSLANLTALLAARAAVAPEAWEQGTPRDLVLLAPPTSHYSVARAASILGLGSQAVYPLPVDGRDVVVPSGVAAAIAQVRRAGKRCLAVVANACSTATGLYDPIEAIAEHCDAAGVWLHVDGAHGASALLSPRERHRLRGIERASSVAWDAHKMLRTSALCAAVLVREAARLPAAFQQEASYIFYGDQQTGVDFIHRTVECTKSALGMKLFLNLAWHGEPALGRFVEGRYAAARRFYALIRARPGFACPFEPEANIVCFRYGNNDQRQADIREALLAEGDFYLSSAVVAGRRYLRLAVMAPATSNETIEALLDAIEAGEVPTDDLGGA